MIVFRDCKPSRNGIRVPAFLDGARDLVRVQSDGGDFLYMGDPLYWPGEPQTQWRVIADDWKVTITGSISPSMYLVADVDFPRILPLQDRHGKEWFAPAILSPKGDCVLPMSMAKDDDGTWQRTPTEQQAQLIAAAKAIREEILQARLTTLPIEVCADWTCQLLRPLYPSLYPVLDKLKLLDDQLISGVLLAVSGFARG